MQECKPKNVSHGSKNYYRHRYISSSSTLIKKTTIAWELQAWDFVDNTQILTWTFNILSDYSGTDRIQSVHGCSVYI